MKSTVLIIILTYLSINLNAQEIEWSSPAKASGAFSSYYVENSKDFYSVSIKGLNNVLLERFENFSQKVVAEMLTKVDGELIHPIKFMLIQEELVVISIAENNKFLKIFYQIFDRDCKPKSDLIPIVVHDKPKNQEGFLMNKVNVIQSENKEFFCIQYSTSPNPLAGLEFDYKVLGKDLKVVYEGRYLSNCIYNQTSLKNNYLTNSGNLILGLVVFGLDEKGKRVNYDVQTEYRICYIKEGKQYVTNVLKDLSFFNSYEILNLNFLPIGDRKLTCTGLYGNTGNSVNGIFFFEYDPEITKVENEKVNPFEEGYVDPFIESKEKVGLVPVSTKVSCQFDNSEMRLLENGGFVVVFEKSYGRGVQSVSNPNTNSGSFYNLNELLIYRMNPDGTIAWIQKIEKDQTEVGAKLNSGHCGYLGSKEYLILFNDNPKNYVATGEYNTSKSIAWSYDDNETCLAMVNVNLEDGFIKRSCIASQELENYRIIPLQSVPNYRSREMNLFLIKKENIKFGLLKF